MVWHTPLWTSVPTFHLLAFNIYLNKEYDLLAIFFPFIKANTRQILDTHPCSATFPQCQSNPSRQQRAERCRQVYSETQSINITALLMSQLLIHFYFTLSQTTVGPYRLVSYFLQLSWTQFSRTFIEYFKYLQLARSYWNLFFRYVILQAGWLCPPLVLMGTHRGRDQTQGSIIKSPFQ